MADTPDFDKIAQEFGGTVSTEPPKQEPLKVDWGTVAKEFGGSVSKTPPKAQEPDWSKVAGEFGGSISTTQPEEWSFFDKPKDTTPIVGPTIKAGPEPGFWERVKGVVVGSPRTGDTPIGRALGYSFEAPSEKHVPTTELPMARVSEMAPEIAGIITAPGGGGRAVAQSPVAQGVAHGLGQVAEGLTTAPNLLMMGGSGGLGLLREVGSLLPRAVSAGFTVNMLHQAYEQAPAFKQAWDSGDPKVIAQTITEMAAALGMAALAGTHAVRGAGADISAGIDAHNTEAARLFEQERAKPTPITEAPSFVLGDEPVPVTLNGENLEIRPAGMSGGRRPFYNIINPETGEVKFGGYGPSINSYLGINGVPGFAKSIEDATDIRLGDKEFKVIKGERNQYSVVDPESGEVQFTGNKDRFQKYVDTNDARLIRSLDAEATQPPAEIRVANAPAVEPVAPEGWSFADAPAEGPKIGDTFEKPSGKFTVTAVENGKVRYDLEGTGGNLKGKTLPIATFQKMMSSGQPAEVKEVAPASSESEVIQPKPSEVVAEGAGADEEVSGVQGGDQRSEQPGEVRPSKGVAPVAQPIPAGESIEPVRGVSPENGGGPGGVESKPTAGGEGEDSGTPGDVEDVEDDPLNYQPKIGDKVQFAAGKDVTVRGVVKESKDGTLKVEIHDVQGGKAPDRKKLKVGETTSTSATYADRWESHQEHWNRELSEIQKADPDKADPKMYDQAVRRLEDYADNEHMTRSFFEMFASGGPSSVYHPKEAWPIYAKLIKEGILEPVENPSEEFKIHANKIPKEDMETSYKKAIEYLKEPLHPEVDMHAMQWKANVSEKNRETTLKRLQDEGYLSKTEKGRHGGHKLLKVPEGGRFISDDNMPAAKGREAYIGVYRNEDGDGFVHTIGYAVHPPGSAKAAEGKGGDSGEGRYGGYSKDVYGTAEDAKRAGLKDILDWSEKQIKEYPGRAKGASEIKAWVQSQMPKPPASSTADKPDSAKTYDNISTKSKKPVTPQIPNEPGAKYVLPTFATAGAKKAPVDSPPGPVPQGSWMNQWDIQESADRFKSHPVLGKATKFLQDFQEEVNSHSDGWPHWKQPAHAAQQLMGLIQNPEYATEENLSRAMGPIRAFYTRHGNAAGMEFPEISLQPKKEKTEPTKRAATNLGAKVTPQVMSGVGPAISEDVKVHDRVHNEWDAEPDWYQDTPAPRPPWSEVVDAFADYSAANAGRRVQHIKDFAADFVEDKGDAHWYRMPAATPLATPEETPTMEAANEPEGAVRTADREPLAEQLPAGGGSPGEGGATSVSGRKSRGVRKPRAGASPGEGAELEPSGGTISGVVGDPAEPERTFPPRAEAVSSADHQHDYRIPDGRVISGSPETRAKNNIEAIKTLRQIQAENRPATVQEQDILAGYVGWGAVPQLFAGRPEFLELQKELKSLLSEEEYSDAQRSTTNAHYTGDSVVDAMWKAVQHLGAKPGMSWLEPAVGVGNFFGRQPQELLQGARRVGLDKDSLSAQIAKLLYPDSGIDKVAFEDAELPKDYFDGAVSNIPFGPFGVHDPEFRGKAYLTGSIHNYFFAKSMTHVRPGGIVAFITSRYSMDAYEKPAVSFRKWVASQADFIGAVRLPAGAFRQSSGTDVITDLIFLRRRMPGESPVGESWVESKNRVFKTPDYPYNVPHSINEYYHQHPERVLGTEGVSRGQFSSTDYDVKGNLTQESLEKALSQLPANLGFQARITTSKSRKVAIRELNAPAEQSKLGGLFFDDKGELYRKTSKGSAEPVDASAPTKKRIKGQLVVRDALVKLTTAELEGKPDKELDHLRKLLNLAYDAFVKPNGPLSSQANAAVMKGDPDAPLLVSLERRFDKGNKAKGTNPFAEKAPIFSRRMLKPAEVATSVGEPKEALYISLNENGRIDWDRMAELTGRTEAQLQQDLNGLVYQDPTTNVWQTAEEYLSGSVRNKLKQARAIAKVDPKYKENAEALEKVQPEDIAPGDIKALLGVTWVPLDRYSEFVAETLGAEHPEKVKVKYAGGNWIIDVGWGNHLNNATKWGTARAGAVEILSDSLNLRRTKILDKSADGSTSVNPDETKSARAKQMELQEHFEQWLFAEPKRADEVARIYNDTQNDLRLRTFDGGHLTLPGMTKDAAVVRGGDLDPHQKAAVWRQIVQPNVMLAHAVGAGKAQPLDAKIATPSGWKRMGDIQVGEIVIAGDGSPTRVEAVFPQGEKDISRVEFSDGSSTECCDEHLWLTSTYAERNSASSAKRLGKDWDCAKPKVRSLSEIKNSLQASHLGAKNHSIPMTGAVQFSPRAVTLDPYLVGFLLGDGCFRGTGTVLFSCAESELISLVQKALPEGCEIRSRSGYDYAICQTGEMQWAVNGGYACTHPVVTPLKAMGLYGKYAYEKHVPDEYLFNSVEVRVAILQGLMDTDGTVGKNGTAVSFTTTSLGLRNAVRFLVQSLGGTVGESSRCPGFTHDGVKKIGLLAYTLSICLPPSICPFRLKRKAEAVRPKSKYSPIRYITKIESIGKKLAQCIRVSHSSHLYVTDDFIVTHNTFEMIAAGMELKRLGLISRPMYVVPNSTLTGWQIQFAALYPQKRVIVFSEKDLEKSKRQQIMAQIATGDWDAVVVPHSSFQFLPTGDAVFNQHFEKLSDDLQEAIDESQAAGLDTRQIKRMEKAKERLLTSLKEKRAADKKDQTVTWEQLGIDQLFVDESHEYKKLGFSTKQGNVAGIDQQGNQKTFDLLMKMRHTQEHGRGVVFATGTPVTNTMGELYSIMRYLVEKELQARGLGKFDEWAANFGRTVDVFEPKVEGGGYQMKARFAKFVNLPELAQLFRSFADVVTSDMIDIPRPLIVGGKRQAVETQLTDFQEEYLQELRDRAKGIRDDPRGSLPDNMLAVYGDAAKMAMDIRMVRPDAPDDPNGRLNMAADKIYRLWKESASVKGTQAVMSDLGKPAEAGGSKSFSAYDELIRKLIERGIPKNEIAHIYQAKNKSQRARLFQEVNDGKIRVVLGSTMKMGVGVNMQQRLYAMHHLDVPHRPSDLEQREGRILRQGNENPEVYIDYYVTKGSLDEAKFSNVVRKAKFINQLMQGKSTVREAEDVGGMIPSLEMFQAMASGDPRVMAKMETDAEVDRLSGVLSGWKNQQYRIRAEIGQIPRNIAWAKKGIDRVQKEIDVRDKTGEVWQIGKQKFSGEKISKDVLTALKKEVLKSLKDNDTDREIGTAFGIPISLTALKGIGDTPVIKVSVGNESDFSIYGDDIPVSDFYRRIKNQIEALDESVARKQATIEDYKKKQKNLEGSLEDKWSYAAKFNDLLELQARLVKELGADKGDDAATAAGDGAEIADTSVEAQEVDEPEEEGDTEDEEEASAVEQVEPTPQTGSRTPAERKVLGILGQGKVDAETLPDYFGTSNDFSYEDLNKALIALVKSGDVNHVDMPTGGRGFQRVIKRKNNPERGGASLDFLTLGASSFIEKDVIPTLINAARGVSQARGDILKALAPASREGAKEAALTLREHAAELARSTDRAEAALDTAKKFFDKESKDSNLEFIDRIENGQPQPAGGYQVIADTIRQILDDRRDRVQNLGKGKLEDYYEDYFPHIWKQPEKAADLFKAWFSKRPMEGGKSFLKQRTIPTIKDGIDMGLEPESTNPVELVLAKVREMDKYIFAHRAMNELKEQGVLKYVRSSEARPEGYEKINDSIATVYGARTEEGAQTIRGQYYAPEPAATVINNYLSPGLRKYGSFRVYMGLANILNQFQLGWSAYHLGFTSYDAATSRVALGIMQAARGNPIKGLVTAASAPVAPFRGIWQGDKVLKEWYKPGSQGAEMGLIVDAMMMAGGRARMDKFYQTTITAKMMEALRQGNIWGALLRSPFALTEQVSRPILEWIVPRQKMAVFADLARLEMEKIGNANASEYREAMARAWDSVDNRMGQLVYDNIFWNKIVKDMAMATVRSVGWNVGTIREIIGGSVDTVRAIGDGLKGKPPDVTPRMAYILALHLVSMLAGGVLFYLATGDRPEKLKDYFFPRRGPKGTPGWNKRFNFPSYVKDEVHYAHDPYMAIRGKIHPLLESILEMLSNEDYYGRPIRNHKDPLVKQMEQMAEHFGEALEPMAVRPLLAPEKERKQETTAEKLLPFVGITEAPKYIKEESKR